MSEIININVDELASKLAHRFLATIYGEDAIWRENSEEFVGLVLRDEVRGDYNKAYEKYYNAIINQKIEKLKRKRKK